MKKLLILMISTLATGTSIVHAESGSDEGYFFTVKNDTPFDVTLSMQQGGDNFYSPEIKSGQTWKHFCFDVCIVGTKNKAYFTQQACNLCGKTVTLTLKPNGTFDLK